MKLQKILAQINEYYFREAKILYALLKKYKVMDTEIAKALGVTRGAINLRFKAGRNKWLI